MHNDRLIFLDIDGVVNTLQIDRKPFDAREKCTPDGWYYDMCMPSDLRVSNRQAIMWLNKICLESKAKIVISSTWRVHGLDCCIQSLRNSGLDETIEIIDCTATLSWQRRGDEIKDWLNAHYSEFPPFIILDDDCDMGELDYALVQCDTWHGFGFPEYQLALEKLQVEK